MLAWLFGAGFASYSHISWPFRQTLWFVVFIAYFHSCRLSIELKQVGVFVSRSLHFTRLEWYFALFVMCMCGSSLGGSVIHCISVFGIVFCSRIGLVLVSSLSFEHAVSEVGMVVPLFSWIVWFPTGVFASGLHSLGLSASVKQPRLRYCWNPFYAFSQPKAPQINPPVTLTRSSLLYSAPSSSSCKHGAWPFRQLSANHTNCISMPPHRFVAALARAMIMCAAICLDRWLFACLCIDQWLVCLW